MLVSGVPLSRLGGRGAGAGVGRPPPQTGRQVQMWGSPTKTLPTSASCLTIYKEPFLWQGYKHSIACETAHLLTSALPVHVSTHSSIVCMGGVGCTLWWPFVRF